MRGAASQTVRDAMMATVGMDASDDRTDPPTGDNC
jgi:hypothetical protein